MRYIGAVLVFGASFMVSGCIWRTMCLRINTLHSLLAALELMSGEISIKNCPMDELCYFLEKNSEACIKDFFKHVYEGLERLGEKSFFDIWSDAVNAELKNLNPFEKNEVIQLGSILGRYELDKQIASINLCRTRLAKAFEKENIELPERKKLIIVFSSSVALMLIMVLI